LGGIESPKDDTRRILERTVRFPPPDLGVPVVEWRAGLAAAVGS
jgi:hypothetical protein